VNYILEVKNLTYSYSGTRPILNNVSLKVEKGQLVTILGPNGAGKSTLLNCAAGLLKPQSGEVLLDGKAISKLTPKQVAKKIAYVPQVSAPIYDYSVRDYISMGRAPHLGMLFSPGKEDYKLVDEAIEMMGIGGFAHKSFAGISGGERQMACITRAIVQQTELILFDEPTSALDYGNQMKIMRVVDKLSKQGYAIMMTTHNPDQPILLGGSVVLVSSEGKLIMGPVNDIMQENLLSSIYNTPLSLTYIEKVGRIACVANKL